MHQTPPARLIALLVGAAGLLAGCPEPEEALRYTIQIQNSGPQPLGPTVAATHAPDVTMWANGQLASGGLAQLAETGETGALADEMEAQSLVTDVLQTVLPFPAEGRTVPRYDPAMPPGPDLTDRQTLVIEGFSGDRISLAGALLGTNDGFWGLNSVEPPPAGNEMTYTAAGYDAGTEENNELEAYINDEASILGPAAIPGDEPDGMAEADNRHEATSPPVGIRLHEGISGEADIPPDFDFSRTIVRVSILAEPAR